MIMEFDDLLIKEVKKYPNLYDNTSVDYKVSYKKELAWKNLADVLGQPATTCQQRWKVLRERYVREKKHLDMPWSSNHCRVMRHPWPFMDQMCFLNSYIRHRNRSAKSSVDFPEIVIQEDNDEISVIENGEDSVIVPKHENDDNVSEFKGYSESVHSLNDMSNHDAKKRKLSNLDDERGFTNSYSQASLTLSSVDEDDLFCLSIASTLKRLPSQEKSCAKLQILQTLHEFQFSTSATFCNSASKNNNNQDVHLAHLLVKPTKPASSDKSQKEATCQMNHSSSSNLGQ